MYRRIIEIETLKTYYYPNFRAVIILHAILFLLVIIIASSIKANIQGVLVEKVFHFPHIWNTITWIASWFNILLGILSIILITNEIQHRTLRKQLIDGLTRAEVLLGKTIVFLILAAYTTIIALIAGLVLGSIKTPEYQFLDIFESFSYLPILFIQSLGYMLLAMLFAFAFRSSSLSIVTYLLYFFPIEPIIRAFMPDTIARFMPVKSISNLTPMPDFVGISLGDIIQLPPDASNELITFGIAGKSIPLVISASFAIIYCLVFILLTKVLVNRKNF
jgi:ABC-2 type transport system permease protein